MTVSASRNPFRVARVIAQPYRLRGETWEALAARCAAHGFRGAVVGPHGSGKTTLLRDLAAHLRGRGERVVELFVNRDAGGALPAAWRAVDPGAVVLADGYDTLRATVRAWLRRRVRRLIVTAHRPCALPTLVRTEARADVLAELVAALRGRAMPLDEAARRLHAHGGNMRDALRALYDEA